MSTIRAVVVIAVVSFASACTAEAPSAPFPVASGPVQPATSDHLRVHGWRAQPGEYVLLSASGCGIEDAESWKVTVVARRPGREEPVGLARLPADGPAYEFEVRVPGEVRTALPPGAPRDLRAGDVLSFAIGDRCFAEQTIVVRPDPWFEVSPTSGPVGTVVTIRGRHCLGTGYVFTGPREPTVPIEGAVTGTTFGWVDVDVVPPRSFAIRYPIPRRADTYRDTGGGPILPGTTIWLGARYGGCGGATFHVTA
jgi:hypothetical protein